jgi:hypothetical protein
MSFSSVIRNFKNFKIIIQNFKIDKNIPIDTRYLVSTYSKINEELPLKLRYNGLMFFVSDILEDGEPVKIGKFYYFDNDLETPKLLSELSIESITMQLDCGLEDYVNLINRLNLVTTKPGSIIHIKPLDIYVYFDGINWNYFAGVYKVTNETLFNTIPNQLKNVNSLVLLEGGIRHIIKSNFSLSEELIIVPSISEIGVLENNRYYLIDSVLFFSIANQLYKIGSKFFKETKNLLNGYTEITHNLGSTNINVYFRIQLLDLDYDKFLTLDFDLIDSNKIRVKNYFLNITGELVIVTI